MAKDTRQNTSKVRIFYAEIEGGDATVQGGIKTIGEALVRTGQPPHVRAVRSLPLPERDGRTEGATLFDPPGEIVGEIADEALDAAFAGAEAASQERATKGGPDRKPPSYCFVKDLNLRPEGKQSLKEFFASKAPDGQQQQFTVIVYYLERVLELSGIEPNHIYTAFNEIEQKAPPFIAQTARNIAKRKGWIDSSGGNNLKVTTKGENFVKHDLPKKPAPAQ